MYKWSSFDEIRRSPSKSGNISTTPESWVLSVQVGDKGSKRRGVGRFWWWLNLYNWPSFEEIRRNPSNSGNQVATSGGIWDPGSSVSKQRELEILVDAVGYLQQSVD